MKEESGLMVNALINHYYKDASNHNLKFLNEEERKGIERLPVPKALPGNALWDPGQIVRRIHYSWFKSVIEAYPEELKYLALAALPSGDRRGLIKLMKLTKKEIVVSGPIKAFFLKYLCKSIIDQSLLPIEFLPQSPMNALLNLSKHQLVRLIDLLGLHDLAIDMRQVLAKKIIDQISGLLTPSEQQFLRYCMQQSDIVITPLEGIQKWITDEQKLIALRHLKGLYRLSAALLEQSESLIWYVVHRLDTGRGIKLQQYLSSQFVVNLNPKHRAQIVEQVNTLLTLFLQQEKSSL